tara:strand:+ start:76 stop:366 length:291 start_codon:yes stop_codon:yes gene_type:complete
MPNNEEQIMGFYWTGDEFNNLVRNIKRLKPEPIKNVTNSITSKDRLIKSNKLLAEDLKELEPAIRMLKNNQWSFDVDPNCHKKNMIMDILNDFDAP